MKLLPTSRRALLGTSFLAATALLATMSALGAIAAPTTPIDPVCPQSRANVGIPLVSSLALSTPDPHAVVSVSAGSLPAGVTLTGDTLTLKPYSFAGTPTTAGSSTFTVKVALEDSAPKTIECTIAVGELPAPTRVAGTDRYEQAAKVSAAAFPTAATVYVASGEKFADALSAGSVAGVHGAPLLLTQAGMLPASTAAELARLKPKDVVVVGGPASIAESVVTALKDQAFKPTVTRIAGADRYEGSRKLIEDAKFGVPEAAWAYVANGGNFPDALAATPAATTKNAPVLLVDGSKPAATAAELATLAGMKVMNLRIAGGVNSVSAGIATSLSTGTGITVERVSGADRYEGAVAINKQAFLEPSTVFLASGEVFPDALSAGPAAAKGTSPIYLVQKTCVPVSVLDDITRTKAKNIVILGGENTVGSQVAALKPC